MPSALVAPTRPPITVRHPRHCRQCRHTAGDKAGRGVRHRGPYRRGTGRQHFGPGSAGRYTCRPASGTLCGAGVRRSGSLFGAGVHRPGCTPGMFPVSTGTGPALTGAGQSESGHLTAPSINIFIPFNGIERYLFVCTVRSSRDPAVAGGRYQAKVLGRRYQLVQYPSVRAEYSCARLPIYLSNRVPIGSYAPKHHGGHPTSIRSVKR